MAAFSIVKRMSQAFLLLVIPVIGFGVTTTSGCSKGSGQSRVAKASASDELTEFDSHPIKRGIPRPPLLTRSKQDSKKQSEKPLEPRPTGGNSPTDQDKAADPSATDRTVGDALPVDKVANQPNEASSHQESESNEPPTEQFDLAEEQTIDLPETWKRMGKNEIWVDFKNKQVIMGGYVCINVGALEMFACPAGTKEHEAIVALNARADEMHASLIAIGAKPGAPCSWDDVSFTSASGSRINIDVRWRDEKSKEVITRSAREMMKIDEKPALNVEFIFGGSRIHKHPESETGYYVANSGEMICVSNFSTAAIDVNIDSSDTNSNLLFWANTERVPPRGTRVYLILTPGEFFKPQRHVFEDAKDKPDVNSEAGKPPAPEPKAGEPKLDDSKAIDSSRSGESKNDEMRASEPSPEGSKGSSP